MGFIDNDHFVLVEISVTLRFRQKNPVGHQFDISLIAGFVVETDLESDVFSDDGIQLLGNSTGNTYLFGKGGGEKASKDLDVPYLGTIPIDPRIREDEDKGEPFVVKHSDSPAAKAFAEIVKKIKSTLNA